MVARAPLALAPTRRSSPSPPRARSYVNGLAHGLRIGALRQMWTDGTQFISGVFDERGMPVPFVTRYAFSVERLGMPFERRWEAVGWLMFITSIVAAFSIFFWATVNHQRR